MYDTKEISRNLFKNNLKYVWNPLNEYHLDLVHYDKKFLDKYSDKIPIFEHEDKFYMLPFCFFVEYKGVDMTS